MRPPERSGQNFGRSTAKQCEPCEDAILCRRRAEWMKGLASGFPRTTSVVSRENGYPGQSTIVISPISSMPRVSDLAGDYANSAWPELSLSLVRASQRL